MIDPFGQRALKAEKEKGEGGASMKKQHSDESAYCLAGRPGSDNETGDHEVNPVIKLLIIVVPQVLNVSTFLTV